MEMSDQLHSPPGGEQDLSGEVRGDQGAMRDQDMSRGGMREPEQDLNRGVSPEAGQSYKKVMKKRPPTALTLECKVCGSPAPDHMHFGAHCCYSCRAFFRRTANRKRNVGSLRCRSGLRNCSVTKETKNCIHCRYQKCVSIGMVEELIQGKRGKSTEDSAEDILSSSPTEEADNVLNTSDTEEDKKDLRAFSSDEYSPRGKKMRETLSDVLVRDPPVKPRVWLEEVKYAGSLTEEGVFVNPEVFQRPRDTKSQEHKIVKCGNMTESTLARQDPLLRQEELLRQDQLLKQDLLRQDQLLKQDQLSRQNQLLKQDHLLRQDQLLKQDHLLRQDQLLKQDQLLRQDQLLKQGQLLKQEELMRQEPLLRSDQLLRPDPRIPQQTQDPWMRPDQRTDPQARRDLETQRGRPSVIQRGPVDQPPSLAQNTSHLLQYEADMLKFHGDLLQHTGKLFNYHANILEQHSQHQVGQLDNPSPHRQHPQQQYLQDTQSQKQSSPKNLKSPKQLSPGNPSSSKQLSLTHQQHHPQSSPKNLHSPQQPSPSTHSSLSARHLSPRNYQNARYLNPGAHNLHPRNQPSAQHFNPHTQHHGPQHLYVQHLRHHSPQNQECPSLQPISPQYPALQNRKDENSAVISGHNFNSTVINRHNVNSDMIVEHNLNSAMISGHSSKFSVIGGKHLNSAVIGGNNSKVASIGGFDVKKEVEVGVEVKMEREDTKMSEQDLKLELLHGEELSLFLEAEALMENSPFTKSLQFWDTGVILGLDHPMHFEKIENKTCSPLPKEPSKDEKDVEKDSPGLHQPSVIQGPCRRSGQVAGLPLSPDLSFTMEEDKVVHSLRRKLGDNLRNLVPNQLFEAQVRLMHGKIKVDEMLSTVAKGKKAQNRYHYLNMMGMPYFDQLTCRTQRELMKLNTLTCLSVNLSFYFFGHDGQTAVEQEEITGLETGLKEYLEEHHPSAVNLVKATTYSDYFRGPWATSREAEAKHESLMCSVGSSMKGMDNACYLLLYGIALFNMSREIMVKLDIPDADAVIMEKAQNYLHLMYKRYNKHLLGWKKASDTTLNQRYLLDQLKECVTIFAMQVPRG